MEDESLTVLLNGPKETVFESESFHLEVKFDENYPFSPPRLQLLTPTYHPNIDKGKESVKAHIFLYSNSKFNDLI